MEKKKRLAKGTHGRKLRKRVLVREVHVHRDVFVKSEIEGKKEMQCLFFLNHGEFEGHRLNLGNERIE